MLVGFHLRSGLNEGTVVAAALARAVIELGHQVEAFDRENSTPFDSAWDCYRIPSGTTYRKWLAHHRPDAIIFIDPPAGNEVDEALLCAASPILFLRPSWELMPNCSVTAYYARVLTPFHVTAGVLADAGVPGVSQLPIDLLLPTTRVTRRLDPNHISLHVPLRGCETATGLIALLSHILVANSELSVTLSSCLAGSHELTRELRQLRHNWGDRVAIRRGLSWSNYQLEFGRHDLTVWPVADPGLGLEAQLSLAVGVPLLTFDHPVADRFVKRGRNGLLVSCEQTYNWCQVPRNVPDYVAMEEALNRLVREPDLAGLRFRLDGWPVKRSEQFRMAVATLLGG